MFPDVLYVLAQVSAQMTMTAHEHAFPNYNLSLLRLVLCFIKRPHSFVNLVTRSKAHNFTCRLPFLMLCYISVSLKGASANLLLRFFPVFFWGHSCKQTQCCKCAHNDLGKKILFRSCRQVGGKAIQDFRFAKNERNRRQSTVLHVESLELVL